MMAGAMSIGAKIYDRSLCLLAREGVDFKYLSRIVIGYAVVYFGLYIIFSFFMLGLIPLIFDLPNIGDAFSILTMMVPFLLGTCFMSLAFSFFYTDKDQPLLMITFFSVPLVFLSGISYPLELMPEFWQWWHYLFPATSGALAFVKLNCMDASLYDIRVEYLTMWIQCIVYFFLACAAIRFNLRRCCEITPHGVVPKGHRYDD